MRAIPPQVDECTIGQPGVSFTVDVSVTVSIRANRDTPTSPPV